MNIAINCAFYQPLGGGIKEYIYNLTHNLSKLDKNNNYILYVLEDQWEYAKKGLPTNFKIKKIPFKSRNTLDKIRRSLLEQKFWLNEEKNEKFDIFHSPFFYSPKLKRARILLTVHDLRLYRFPRTYSPLRYIFLNRKVKSSLRNADHIISISHFTKKEITDLCGVDPSKVTVIPEAINRKMFSTPNESLVKDIPEVIKTSPFLLTVGHLEPRKNYNTLIKVFAELRKKPEHKNLQLVIVGKKGHQYQKTLKLIKNTEGVHYLNFVSHETLKWLYHNTKLFVFPSIYEGFGFPPLEAASFGSVSAVSKISSIPEVCGDAVFYFDPYNWEDIYDVIDKIVKNETLLNSKKELLEPQLNKFSWEQNASETINVYKLLNRIQGI